MNDFEIGVDVQHIAAFEKCSQNFLKKIFTRAEIKYCYKKTKPAMHLAARFAAKEAAMKAIFSMGKKAYYRDIEILIKNKKPELNIAPLKNERYKVKVSMSHSGEYTVAFVIIYTP